ncbi:MAG: gliding motility-associated C-terminal domain-containing protein [Bacteroidota bacterium]
MSKTKKIFLVVILLHFSQIIFSQVPSTWTVNVASYQYQMTMTCKANEACIDLADTNNYIAAFVGNQCRGVVKTKITVGANKLGLITIKSNIITGELVKFQIYKASDNAVLNVLDSVIFNHGTQTGTLANPFMLYTNHVPTDIAISSYTIAENSPLGTPIASLSATDQDAGSTFNYSLTTGQAENNQFSISGNQLVVNANYDYETDSVKIIELHVDDIGGCSYIETFTISIIDGNDAPTALYLSSPLISDHQQNGSFMGEFSTVDPDLNDAHVYSLVVGTGDTDNSQFYIQNDTLYNSFTLDYTAQSVYFIRARSTDLGGLFIENTFTLNVSNVNDAPSDILINNVNVDENMPVGTLIGTLTVIDNDLADTHTLTVDPGLDSLSFTVVGNILQTNASFNFEAKDTFLVNIRATDPYAAYYVKTFTIVVNDINDVPTDISLSTDSIQELKPVNTLIGDFSTTDEDAGATHNYSLAGGTGDTDNSLFVIVGNQLFSNITYTYTGQTYSIRVRSTDNGGLLVEKIFAIKIYNVNEAPLNIIIDTTSLLEDNDYLFRISNIRTVDNDNPDDFSYSLVFGQGSEDNSEFEIQGDDLFILTKTNYDVKDVYHIRVRSTDLEGLFVEKQFDITVTDISGNTIPLPSTNYISPNGDGKNDFWKVENVDIYHEFALQVFDQFGLIIFEVPYNYNNEFDGKYNGNTLPTGNYYYVFKNERITYKGNITIVN